MWPVIDNLGGSKVTSSHLPCPKNAGPQHVCPKMTVPSLLSGSVLTSGVRHCAQMTNVTRAYD